MKGRLETVALLLLVSHGAFAEEAVDDGKRLVDEFVTDVVTFQGNFEQALIDADGQVVEQDDRYSRDPKARPVSLVICRSL